ncbi:peptide maturation system acyl carrier-related protein [Blautia schinkii]|nr:peptide maturation system acyl carrier-related protein [Blautia schinkii]
MTNSDCVDNALNQVFVDLIGIDFNENCLLKGEKLFGQKINMKARELVVLLYEIEDRFKVSFDNSYITKGEFDTYNQILKILLNCEPKV